MNIQMLKERIKNECFDSNGIMDCHISYAKNFKELYSMILEQTQFLDQAAKSSERIYCILNDIIERKKCDICKNYFMEYINFYKGYCKSCAKCHFNILTNLQNKLFNQPITDIKEFIKETLIKPNGDLKNYILLKKQFKQTLLGKEILNLTNFLDKKISFQERIYCILNNCRPNQCLNCKKETRLRDFKKYGYGKFCSTKCSNIYRTTKLKIENLNNNILPIIYQQGFEVCIPNNFRRLNNTQIELTCTKCNTKFTRTLTGNSYKNICCPGCYFSKRISREEKEFAKYIKTLYKNEIIENYRPKFLAKRELDLYLPDIKLAFEYNGIYWHKGKEHIEELKSRLCEENGIRLIHIPSEEWKDKQKKEEWKSYILKEINI